VTVLNLLVVFAIAVVAVYAALFIAGVRRRGQAWTLLVGGYVGHLVKGAGIGLALAVAVVFAVTAYYDSPQGPLSLIILGPLAIFAGGLVGAYRWLIKAPAA